MPNMGIPSELPVRSKPAKSLKLRPESIVNAFFSSTQQRVLGLLFGQPNRSFFSTEIIGRLGAGSGAVQRELKRLADSGQGSQLEIDGLLRSAQRRLQDAENKSLNLESRFDPAYNSAHALALAALRWHRLFNDSRVRRRRSALPPPNRPPTTREVRPKQSHPTTAATFPALYAFR